MPDVTPIGPLAVAADSLRTLISNVPFFQTWVGAANAAAALPSIFTGELGVPITSVTVSGGVATITTREQHPVSSGQMFTIEGAAAGPESGLGLTGRQTAINTTGTSLTFATSNPDQPAVYPDYLLLLPAVRPLAIVCERDDGLNSTSVGTGGASILAGVLDILIEADVSSTYVYDSRNALMEARNAYGQFVQGLMNTQETGDLMYLGKVEPVSGPNFTSRAESDDNALRYERWRALVRVTWGLEG